MALRAGYKGIKGTLYDIIMGLPSRMLNAENSLAGAWENIATKGARNMLYITESTGTSHQVTFTINTDGSISLSGTADANTTKNLTSYTGAQIKAMGKKIRLWGGLSSNIYITFRTSDWAVNIKDLGEGVVISTEDLVDATTYYISIVVANGTNTSGKVMYPMITLGSDEFPKFSSYALSNEKLTELTSALIKTDTFTGTTSASGNLLLSSGTSRIVIGAQIGGRLCIPYSTGGTSPNQNGHVMDFDGSAVASTSVSGVYYYIDAPAVLTRSAAPEERSLDVEVEEPVVVKKSTRKTTKKTEEEE